MICKELFVFCVLLITVSRAQNITPVGIDDLKKSYYAIDSTAEAVVLYKYCRAIYEHDGHSFRVTYEFHVRVKLLHQNAFHLATVGIVLRKRDIDEERIKKLNATIYFLENGEMKSIEVDKSAMYKDKIYKSTYVYKFAFPHVQEGAIIDYSYKIESPFFWYLKPWYFEENYPVLWSEYDVTVPAFFQFVNLSPKEVDFKINKIEKFESTIMNYRVENVHYRWVRENLLGLKLGEPYVSSLDNYKTKIDFQLARINYPEQPPISYLESWEKFGKDAVNEDFYYKDLYAKNAWLSEDVQRIVVGCGSDLDKAKRIYSYIRDQFVCKDDEAIILSKKFKKTLVDKNGNVADLNGLLIAMLRNANLNARPVILSTRDNGKVFEQYPIVDEYNYLICSLKIDSLVYLLDASSPYLGFGKIPLKCYNGTGRVIDEVPELIAIDPMQIKEVNITTASVHENEEGKWIVSLTCSLGDDKSEDVRMLLSEISVEDYFKRVKKHYPYEFTYLKQEILYSKDYDKSLVVKYDIMIEPDINGELIYFNPLFDLAYTSNPFKSETRLFPVEFPCTSSGTYILNFDIPKGYVVEELPKSAKVVFRDKAITFEYLVQQTSERIQLRTKIQVNQVTFEAKDYEALRKFYAYIVQTEKNKIVLRKIK